MVTGFSSHTDVFPFVTTKTALRVVSGNFPMKLRLMPPLCKNNITEMFWKWEMAQLQFN